MPDLHRIAGTRRPGAAVLFICVSMLAAACGSDSVRPEPEPEPQPVATALLAVNAPTTAHSGTATSLTFRVLDQDEAAMPGRTVQFSANRGTVEPAAAETDANGDVTVSWQLEDQDLTQTLTASTGTLTRTISLRTTPLLSALVLQPPAGEVALGE